MSQKSFMPLVRVPRGEYRFQFFSNDSLIWVCRYRRSLCKEWRGELSHSGLSGSLIMPLAETLTIMETMDKFRRYIGLVYPK